jgi:hypothetical protein
MGKMKEIMHRDGQNERNYASRWAKSKKLCIEMGKIKEKKIYLFILTLKHSVIKRLKTGCIKMGKDRITGQNHRKNTIVRRSYCRIIIKQNCADCDIIQYEKYSNVTCFDIP